MYFSYTYVYLYLLEKYPNEFSNLYHALDRWHKSVKLSKKLAKVCLLKLNDLLITF